MWKSISFWQSRYCDQCCWHSLNGPNTSFLRSERNSQKSKLESTKCSEKCIKIAALGALTCWISMQAAAVCVSNWTAGGTLFMGQCAIPCSSVLHGKPVLYPQEGTGSLRGTAATLSPHQTAPLLPLGERKGCEPHELPPKSSRGGQQLSLQISLNAGIEFWLSFTLPKCSVPNSRPALC